MRWAWLALGFAAWMPEAAEAGERRYALVVGTNQGVEADAPLRFAEDDARRLGEVLVRLGGVEPGDLTVLTRVSANPVRRALERLSERLEREVSPEDQALVLVYYSGHADAEALHLEGTRLSLHELRERVETLPADVRLLVVDACKAGELLRLKGGVQQEPFEIQVTDHLANEGMAVITSAAAGEDAQESDRLRGGVFTHHLIAGLQGAADDTGDLRVTLDEAFRYTYTRTLSSTSSAPVVQHPSYAFDLRGRSNVVLTELADVERMGRLRLAQGGRYLVFSRRDALRVTEVEVARGAMLTLPVGQYRVLRREPNRVYQIEATVVVGQVTSVEAASMELLPLGQAARRGEGETHFPIGVQAGGGVTWAPTDVQGPGPLAWGGVRVESSWATLMMRLRGAYAQSSNADLSLIQTLTGAELGVIRTEDVGRASVGLGLAIGANGVWQRFDTTGVAPSRQALTGLLAPVGRLEWAFAPRVTVGLELRADIHIYPDLGADDLPQLGTSVTPAGGLDVTTWIR